jgi:hypothetical protein
MSHAFIHDLSDRKRQVRHYMLIVASEERSAKFGALGRVQEVDYLPFAGGFLILYNLIEATIRGAIEAVYSSRKEP